MFFITVAQIAMSILDLIGVALMGLLGALSVTAIQSTNPGPTIGRFLELFRIENLSFQNQIFLIGFAAVAFLVSRTLLAIYSTKRILLFFSRRGARLSSSLISKLLSRSLTDVNSRSSQETLYAVTTGVSVITLEVLATSIVLLADISLLFVMAVALFFVEPSTALGTFAFFAAIGAILNHLMHRKARNLGELNSQLNISSNEKIIEIFGVFRELYVRNRRNYYANEIGVIRNKLANITSDISFLPYVSKYVLESSVIIGAMLISAIQFMLKDASHAVSTLAIFIAAGSRIAPAVLRIQQGAMQINNRIGIAKKTLELIEELSMTPEKKDSEVSSLKFRNSFDPGIILKDVLYKYPGVEVAAIKNINLSILPGSTVAIVGASGAGKSTLIDLMLGLISPDFGSVAVSGVTPQQAVSEWAGAIAYVPQEIYLKNGSIAENISIGYSPDEYSKDDITRALKIAHLSNFVSTLEFGAETSVGERGARLSGGQKQRLGIARAMFTSPQILIMDEATSALDGGIESDITDSIRELKGLVTVVMVAHRLSTVRYADQVVYMSDGEVLATGTFEQVRSQIPDFDKQARLMGL